VLASEFGQGGRAGSFAGEDESDINDDGDAEELDFDSGGGQRGGEGREARRGAGRRASPVGSEGDWVWMWKARNSQRKDMRANHTAVVRRQDGTDYSEKELAAARILLTSRYVGIYTWIFICLLFTCVYMYVYMYVSIHMYLFMYVCIYVYTYPFKYVSIYLFIYLFYLSTYSVIFSSIYACTYLSVFLFIYLPIYLSICLYIYMYKYTYIFIFIYTYIYLYIYVLMTHSATVLACCTLG